MRATEEQLLQVMEMVEAERNKVLCSIKANTFDDDTYNRMVDECKEEYLKLIWKAMINPRRWLRKKVEAQMELNDLLNSF